jgi:hypothetical protein
MAYYLVSAKLNKSKLHDLKARLESQEIKVMRPFGSALDESLRAAKVAADGLVLWEEQDYCQPPLAMERRAVLDDYFSAIQVEKVNRGEGWQQLADLPSLWSDLLAEAQ